MLTNQIKALLYSLYQYLNITKFNYKQFLDLQDFDL